MNGATRHRRRERASLARIFAIPLAILFASISGLVLGLAGDGLPDLFAWALLSLPIIAAILAWTRRS